MATDHPVGATLVVARVGQAVHHPNTGDHKGRPYGSTNDQRTDLCRGFLRAGTRLAVGGIPLATSMLSRLQLRQQRLLVGKLAGLMLRIHEVAVHAHIKDAARSFDEHGFRVEGILQLGSQTDRLGLVVSGHAELDGNVHGFASLGLVAFVLEPTPTNVRAQCANAPSEPLAKSSLWSSYPAEEAESLTWERAWMVVGDRLSRPVLDTRAGVRNGTGQARPLRQKAIQD